MKTLPKLKIVFVIMITAFLISCKNNKDGYSDEIDTRQTPVDTSSADTSNVNKQSNTTGTNSTGATGTESEGVTGAGSISAPNADAPAAKNASTKGTGTGPGPSAKDGAAYDISSQTKKDTTKLGTKAKEKIIKK